MIFWYQFSLIKFGDIDYIVYICIGNLREN